MSASPILRCAPCALLLAAAIPLYAAGPLSDSPPPQRDSVSFEEAVLLLSAQQDLSDLSETDMEHYADLLEHPVPLNRLSRAGLLSSGLFSAYQVECILDWRRRYGDILSPAELGVVDSFTPLLVRYLAMFVRFDPSGGRLAVAGPDRNGGGQATSAVDSGTYGDRASADLCGEGNATSGCSFKVADGKGALQYLAGLKGSLGGFWGQLAAGVASKSPWALPPALPEDFSISLSYSSSGSGVPHNFQSFFTQCVSQVVLGCFNVRLGQGLAMWTGASIASFSNAASLMKRPSGISPYTSYAPSYAMRGAAVRFDMGRISLLGFADMHGGRCGASLGWNHRHGEVGLSVLACAASLSAVSVDFQHTVRGTVLYGELCAGAPEDGGPFGSDAFSAGLKGIAGVRFPWGPVDCGVRILYSRKEHNVSAAASYSDPSRRHALTAAGTFSFFPVASGRTPGHSARIKATATWTASPWNSWNFVTRFNLRLCGWGEGNRYELRQDASLSSGLWRLSARIDATICSGFGILGYLEAGYRSRIQTYLQCGLFNVGAWPDRIYVYRRDAPPSFNIPAMYGRGYYLTAYSSMKLGSRVKLYLHADWTGYPWARESDTRRRPSLSARIQCEVKW